MGPAPMDEAFLLSLWHEITLLASTVVVVLQLHLTSPEGYAGSYY